jgi:hypothetical protein
VNAAIISFSTALRANSSRPNSRLLWRFCFGSGLVVLGAFASGAFSLSSGAASVLLLFCPAFWLPLYFSFLV